MTEPTREARLAQIRGRLARIRDSSAGLDYEVEPDIDAEAEAWAVMVEVP